MSRPRKSFPTPRNHKGAAVVDVYQDGRRRTVTLGPWNSEQSAKEFARLLAESQAGAAPAKLGSLVTVNEILLAFLDHAEMHYRRKDKTLTNEVSQFKQTFRPLRELYGHIPASEFGPLALRVLRERMIDLGWARSLINQRVGRVKNVFKWAVSQQLVPVSVFQALATVAGLQPGRTKARETEPILPIAEEHVLATLPYVQPTVRAMILVELLTGVRPEEVCSLRPCDLDTSGCVWVYRPPQHKTRHRGKTKEVAIGPKAQALLSEFAPHDPNDYYFSPRRAVEQFHALRAANRKTPKYPSHVCRNASKRKNVPQRRPGAKYLVTSYEHAVARAVKRANRERKKAAEATGLSTFEPVPHWHPNQLRHSRGTQVREKFGLEAAQVILGHERADVTQIYAEKNLALAKDIAAKTG
ncbi:MAG: site-specific integrase [Planctomycetes bacterium]|nr:site-specific integrase [Planctomycetota bacterium]